MDEVKGVGDERSPSQSTEENEQDLPVSLLADYFRFLRSPTLIEPSTSVPIGKAKNHILRLYTVHLILILVVGALIQSLGLIESNLMTGLFEKVPVWFLAFFMVIAAPVVEETIFRLPLRPYLINIVLAGSLIAAYCIGLYNSVPRSLIIILGTALIGFNLYLRFSRSRAVIFQPLYARYPGFIFYLFVVLFGTLHITNYTVEVWPFLPLLVLPQIILGLWLGFVRLRYGFGWAVFGHAFHNGCVSLPLLLLKLLGIDILAVQQDAEDLPIAASLIVITVGILMWVGLIACATAAWKTTREWIQYRKIEKRKIPIQTPLE